MAKIIIKTVARPMSNNPEDIIRYICIEFGFSSGLDEDKSVEKILEELAEAARDSRGLTSSELQKDKELARSTVIYHLNRFIDSGLVVKQGRQYYLRAMELSKAIEEIEYDLEKELKKMIDTAREFDKEMSTRLKAQR
ncbi:MAG: winged helix-turn-helix domain-containing protein [Candidatus Marsarchaeota archaeon]|nr:winged helix-turn-helix domain-containing protein [Candidatus Marsarchaeota archaeon]